MVKNRNASWNNKTHRVYSPADKDSKNIIFIGEKVSREARPKKVRKMKERQGIILLCKLESWHSPWYLFSCIFSVFYDVLQN